MTNINDGGLAFPGTRLEQVGTLEDHGVIGDDTPTYDDVPHSGMTLRDWFAGQAIGSVVIQCAPDLQWNPSGETPEQYFARKAYMIADALLAAREVAK